VQNDIGVYSLPPELACDLDLDNYAPLASMLYLDSKKRENWTSYLSDVNHNEDIDGDRAYNSAMTFGNAEIVTALCKRLGEIGCNRVVELGSGPGELSVRFILEGDQRHATCVDCQRPPILDSFQITKEQRRRINWLDKNILALSPNDINGCLVMSRILMGYTDDAKQKMLKHIQSICADNQILLLNEFDPNT
jgi:hypothetical protein